MARDEKRVELRPVDDAPAGEAPVIRLESGDTPPRQKPVRIAQRPEEAKVSHRLDLPVREDFEARTHQPGIEVLVEKEASDPQFMEKEWGSQASEYRIPWGWFALIGLAITGAVVWSLAVPKTKSAQEAEAARAGSASEVVENAAESVEATELIDRMEATTRRFFAASTVEIMVREVRQPTRVEPLMKDYYGSRPIPQNRLLRTHLMQPLTIDNLGNFWMATVELADHTNRNLLIEILENGEPRVDWETLVCYQPMKWDAYATGRPAGSSLAFRVYAEPDHFFSHEFADSDVWSCFRLTAPESDEALFGYAKAGGPVAAEIEEILSHNPGSKAAMILRLNVPEDLKSRRGVVIEKVECPRWMYVNPPET